MMKTYLGTLKKGIAYNIALQSYLEEHGVVVMNYLNNLQILVMQAEKEIAKEDFNCFEILEMEKKDFTI